MDRVETKILLEVAVKSGENPDRRKGKGSPVKLICWGLVDPNRIPSWRCGKGKQVNIPVPFEVVIPCINFRIVLEQLSLFLTSKMWGVPSRREPHEAGNRSSYDGLG